MNKPRYSIVRLDNCPSKFEKGFNDYFVCDGRGKDTRLGKDKIICKNCRYGDTKEQLIKKIETAVSIMRNKMENKEVYLDRAVVTFIVEFLGVE